jgi:hypothetical protein
MTDIFTAIIRGDRDTEKIYSSGELVKALSDYTGWEITQSYLRRQGKRGPVRESHANTWLYRWSDAKRWVDTVVPMPREEYCSTREIAEIINLSYATLGQWRSNGDGPLCRQLFGKYWYHIETTKQWAADRRANDKRRRKRT